MPVHVNASISLDGCTAGPGVAVDNPLGTGGEQLHEWLFADPQDPVDAEVAAAMFDRERVGAVVMGRRTFDPGIGHWGDDGTFGMPCFVVTHRPEPPLTKGPTTFTFVDDLDDALDRATNAAAGKVVNVMGAEVSRQLLARGLVDEVHLNLVPVVLGAGARLFTEPIDLRQLDVRAGRAVTHLRYAVLR